MTRANEKPRAGAGGDPVPDAGHALRARTGRDPRTGTGPVRRDAATSPTPAGTARDRAKADRRAALLAAAARLFAERGFDGVTLGDIGEAAGVSGPAVYRHVASKQALLGAILVDVSERLLDGGHAVTASTTADVPDDTPPPTARDRRVVDSPRSRARTASAPAPPPHVDARDLNTADHARDASTTADIPDDTPSPTVLHRRVVDDSRSRAQTASLPVGPEPPDAVLRALVDFHVAFALAEADVIRVQDRDLDRLSDADRGTVRRLQNAYVTVWTDALAAAFPDAETPAERRVRALACFGLINSTPHSVRGVPASRVRPTLARMALAALTA